MSAPVITEPGVYDIPDEVYHADPIPGESLSASGARLLLPPNCPARYRYDKDHPPESTPYFDLGHAAHKMVLGVGAEIEELKYDNWRTAAVNAAADKARAEGKIPLLSKDLAHVIGMAEAIRRHPIASVLLAPGNGLAERSYFWVDEETGIWRRSRLDWTPNPSPGRMVLVDYKSTKSAHPQQFSSSVADYGYHCQRAWYGDAVIAAGLTDEQPAFVFVAQEKTPPYLISVTEIDDTAIRIGRALNRRAINIFAECVRTGEWPGYSEEVELISLPYWYERKFEEFL